MMAFRKNRQRAHRAEAHSFLDIALFTALAALVLIAIAGRPTPALGTDPGLRDGQQQGAPRPR